MAGLLDDLSTLVGAAASPYGLPAKGEWPLNNGSFRSLEGDKTEVVFYISDPKKNQPDNRTALESMQDSGGRRLAIYEYPYRDGQDIDDLGRKGEKWTFNLYFFGENYRQRADLFDKVVVQSKSKGKLTHPTKGQITAKLGDYERAYSYDKWQCVAYRITFLEDNTGSLQGLNNTPVSTNSALRNALSFLNSAQGTIGAAISAVSALLLLPGAIQNAMKLRLSSITNALQGLLGQMAATFSSDAQLTALASQTGSFLASSTGTTITGEILPAVFQVGVSPDEAALVAANQQAYVNAAQITPQTLVYQMNQIRATISAAIAEVEANTGCDGSDIVQAYRELAVEFQYAVEAACASAQSAIVYYTVPFEMSVRMVASVNGLTPDRGNDVAALNPELESINFVPRGTILAVPAA